jgi:hypothetical protein
MQGETLQMFVSKAGFFALVANPGAEFHRNIICSKISEGQW